MTIGSVCDFLIRYKTLITVLVTRCTGGLVVYGTIAYITNSVTLKDASDFIYFQNLLFLMCSIITLGLEPWYTKKSSTLTDDGNENISFLLSSFVIPFSLFCVLSIVITSTVYVFDLDNLQATEIFLMLFSAFCMSLIKIYQSFFVGKNELVKSVFIEQILINIFLIVIMNISHVKPIVAYQLSIIFTLIVSTLQIYITYFRFSMIRKIKIKFRGFIHITELIDYGEILICTMVVLYFPYQYSKWFIETEDVAGLLLCYKISSLLLIFYIAMNSSIAKRLVSLWNSNSYIGFFKLVEDSTKVCICVSIFFFFSILSAGDILLDLFGNDFMELYWTLVIICLGQCIFVSLGAIGYALLMSGYQRRLRRALRKNTLTGLLIGVVVIPIFGNYGAAITILFLISGQHLFLIKEYKAIRDEYV
ncbi:lipopolysaccharide biosynthesis protein [Vibrio aestuarianus]|uniref:lipopolysaccharide biosynthesis protein n=1 Tax=Vibrio aestuarianus TaxID=28171 RepID=UPI0040697F67